MQEFTIEHKKAKCFNEVIYYLYFETNNILLTPNFS